MDKKLNNFLRAYGAEIGTDKKKIIERLIEHLSDEKNTSDADFKSIITSLSKKLNSEEDDLAIIRKIIKEID